MTMILLFDEMGGGHVAIFDIFIIFFSKMFPQGPYLTKGVSARRSGGLFLGQGLRRSRSACGSRSHGLQEEAGLFHRVFGGPCAPKRTCLVEEQMPKKSNNKGVWVKKRGKM